MSRHAALSDDTIWSAISAKEETFWGCRWPDRTRFAVLDVDAGSQYHNELGLARLKHALASVGIDLPLLYQSSASGGWHTYLSFSDRPESLEVYQTLKQWLQKETFVVQKGQLEIFPSNNGLRLPLQRGFAWLDEQGTIRTRREELTQEEAVARFLQDLDANSHSWQLVKERIETRIQEIEKPAAAAVSVSETVEEDGFSAFFTMAGLIPEVYEHGRKYWAQGLTGPNQRHHAILCVGHYLWYGDESQGVAGIPGIRNAGRRAEAIEQWLRANHNGFSESLLRGDWDETVSEIRRACHWTSPEGTERGYESYALTERSIERLEGLTKKTGRVWYREDFQKGNIGREETARQKIRAALSQLVESNRRITVAGLARVSGCKKETVRRHIDIWGALRLSKGPGDLNLLAPGFVRCSGSEMVQEKDSVLLASPQSDSPLASLVSEPEFAPAESEEKPQEIVLGRLTPCANKLSGATANNSTAGEPPSFPAVSPHEFSSGVNRWRTLSACMSRTEKYLRHKRATSPRDLEDRGSPPIYSSGIFSMAPLALARLARSEGTKILRATFFIGSSGTNLTASGENHSGSRAPPA
jgi:hypothetical protein